MTTTPCPPAPPSGPPDCFIFDGQPVCLAPPPLPATACATPVPVSPFLFLALLGIAITVAALREITRKRQTERSPT